MPHFPKPFFRKARKLWYVQINGKQQNLGADQESAFARYNQLMRESKQRPVSSDSVVAILDRFLEWTRNHRAPRTFEWYQERLQWLVSSIPTDLTTQQVKSLHVQDWLDSRPKWSDGMKRGCLVAVQRCFSWVVQIGLIEKSPIAHIEKLRAGSRNLVITVAEHRKIVFQASDQEFRDLLTCA